MQYEVLRTTELKKRKGGRERDLKECLMCNGFGWREKEMMTKAKARRKVEEGESRSKMIELYPPQIFPKIGALLRPIVRIAG